jgi:3-hydroxyacyl-CoA dehydrogenase / 3-hydroxy-2-methylbutyryl-CoA dehydrogenase
MKISNVVGIVTGGASGIGAACCRRLVEMGAKGVVISDLNEKTGTSLAAELGDRAIFIATDVSDLSSVEAAVAATEKCFGPVNTVIASAGITAPAKLMGRSGMIAVEKFDAAIKTNLYGTLYVIRCAVQSMMKAGVDEDGERGVILCVSSGAAFEGQIGQIGYSAAKAAIVGMTFPLMRELAPEGIRVVTVAPGAFDTPIYGTVPPEVKAGLVAQMLFPKRMGRVEEFALFAEEIIRNPMHNGRTYRFDAGVILNP